MKDEEMIKYPDFLADFKELEALAKWQRYVLRGVLSEAERMLKGLKLENFYGSTWDNVINWNYGMGVEAIVKELHKRYPVTTWEVIERYIRLWLSESKATVTYDKETQTVTIGLKEAHYKPNIIRNTRNILPCNMALVFNVEEVA